MEAINRYQGALARPGLDPKFVAARVSALWAATETYGKPCDGALQQAWDIVTRLEEITSDEFSRGTEHYMRRGGKMPTPGEFADWVKDQRDAQDSAQRLADLTRIAKEEDAALELELNVKYKDWDITRLRAHMEEILGLIEKKGEL